MRVTLNITHTWCSDLDIALISPDGRYLKLTSDNGGGGDNFIDTIFSDFAAASITTGVAPFTGEFRAEGGAFGGADVWAGAEVLPATALVDLAGFAGGGANGDWRLAIFDDAGGDVGVLNSWSIEFISSSQLGGIGSASGAGVCPAGGSTLITVRAIPATGPSSTGITGSVNLTSVGGGAAQALFDNGTNGDVTAGDNIFSYRHTMPATQPTGTQTVAWTLRDAQNRTATGNASFNVNCLAFQDNCEDAVVINGPGTYDFDTTGMTVDGPGACTGNGSANAWLKYRATRTGEARIHTCGLTTMDTVLAVYDACGGTVVGCDDDTCAVGLQSEIFLPVTAGTDYWIRISGFGAAIGAGQVGIEEQGGRLLATANVSPDPVGACEPMLVTATVTPGTDPTSTGITVTADLSDFGGGTAETMFDDGTNGDAAAGDNVWSLNVDDRWPMRALDHCRGS
jgi:subtilisin-like proprotein convertase family protein